MLWNARQITLKVQAFGDLIREKTLEDQEEMFWFLTVVLQNAIILWSALSLPVFTFLSCSPFQHLLLYLFFRRQGQCHKSSTVGRDD